MWALKLLLVQIECTVLIYKGVSIDTEPGFSSFIEKNSRGRAEREQKQTCYWQYEVRVGPWAASLWRVGEKT